VTHAVALAKHHGAKLTFIHALPDRPLPFFGGEGGMFVDQVEPEEFDEQAKKFAGRILIEAEAEARAAGVACERAERRGGPPYEAIIAEANARDCDLILMASHGYTGMKAMVLGSETNKVLTHSRIPVLVYR
jgi:nucleotide-binding universal stress UspA family protein